MSAQPGAMQGGGKTALVVEDERLVRMLIVDALEECGYTVLEAADGSGALRILQTDQHIDLLLSDHHLPGEINGRSLAEFARRTRPELAVLLVSGLPGAVITGNRALPEWMRLLAKPFSTVRLVQAVAEMMSSTKMRGDS